jgi:Ca2+/Na+ antiporter
VMTSTVGLAFAIQARFADRRVIDFPVRLVLAATALVVLFHPDQQLAAWTCLPVWLFVAYWVLLRRDAAIDLAPNLQTGRQATDP